MTFASIRSTTTVLVSTDSVGVFGWKTLRATVFGDEKVSPKHWRHHQQPSFSLYEMLFFSEQWTFTSADPLNSTYMLIFF